MIVFTKRNPCQKLIPSIFFYNNNGRIVFLTFLNGNCALSIVAAYKYKEILERNRNYCIVLTHHLDHHYSPWIRKKNIATYSKYSTLYFPQLQRKIFNMFALCEMCPNTKFFLVRVFCIRTECGEIRSISPCSVGMRENTDQKKFHI